ncbi:polyphosphate kinase 1 [Mucilaginibacter sp. RS28]|uniref:Polyphosphate kinase n=1 Tax=Mucilaginibacter straminoryzae TaxID=2932774 RepID=A0A9X1X8R8_9SPHI|nr:polyphosphate kinase 1 [Mucilaginibacter straminoryzae]MCJ8211813.1 polyphosphate kinase 1 [Mucilaginibacter straminoryzae]
MEQLPFFDRDLSWLAFNKRVLEEAANPNVPVLERIKFLGIYSSNLDEFYRVRMPVMKALQKISKKSSNDFNYEEHSAIVHQATGIIQEQQNRFGSILREQIIPELKQQQINLLYREELPVHVADPLTQYFLSEVLAFLHPVLFNDDTSFFPENNKLYFIVQLSDVEGKEQLQLLNIPSEDLPRFYPITVEDEQYICFLDDIIRYNLDKLFRGFNIVNCFSFKVTRDAELDLKDEYSGDLSEQIEQQLGKRDSGFATRFLYEQGMPLRILEKLKVLLNLQTANAVEGGRYHNLKDLSAFPLKNAVLSYQPWPARNVTEQSDVSLQELILKGDIIVHPPYQSYHTILRYFNEAAADPDVEEIYVTLYRVASDSRIVNALMTAARNGKQVQVVVELKARFDEANNLKWAKKMKEAGVKIIYSITALKVHAKVALVKSGKNKRTVYTGLLATGNLNEGTARFYTDHILLTANHQLLREAELLFIFLARREKVSSPDLINFKHLLVAQFNLQQRFLQLIDREIENAKQGLPAAIQIKLNNLEEKVLISKLYEASQAGVKISLIVRSICCLVPGVKGISENITILRIVDRYLEHGRIFIFNNNGNPEVFMGSADWMNRNIYHRIEVCFPVYDEQIKAEMITLFELQWKDNVQAVEIDQYMNNLPVKSSGVPHSAQKAIYDYLKG